MTTAAPAANATPLLEVERLRVVARRGSGSGSGNGYNSGSDNNKDNDAVSTIVDDVSFAVRPGEVTALIGESGSGKTTTSLACMGYARAGCEIVGGRVRLAGTDVLTLADAQRRALRGVVVAYIAQSAAAAFNSALTLNRQVIETALINGLLSEREATAKAVALYRALDLPDPQRIGRRYPHQVSGGQLQRLMAAMAMICDPQLLILDEPTTALDVTTQIEVLKAFKKLIRGRRTAALYVSHDLAVVAQMADHIVVLKDGRAVESGPSATLLQRPRRDYTRRLIDAARRSPVGAPRIAPDAAPDATPNVAPDVAATPALLRVDAVSAGYGRARELALERVSLRADASRTLGVIGESGSGKTTLGRVISGLTAPRAGHVELLGERLAGGVAGRRREQLRAIQFAFQMADVALNPRHPVGKILGRPLAFYFGLDSGAAARRVAELLALVELPADYAARYPQQLSGGERQRVNLARALAAEPRLIVCDEITSALDSVVAATVLTLLQDLQRRLQVGYIFISHDISTVAAIADTIAVMRAGRVIEYGPAAEVLTPPHHPYTELLLKSVPQLRGDWLDTLRLPDAV